MLLFGTHFEKQWFRCKCWIMFREMRWNLGSAGFLVRTCHWRCVSVNRCWTFWHVPVLRKIPMVLLFTYCQAHGCSILQSSKLDSASLQGLSFLHLTDYFTSVYQQCCSLFFKNKLLYIPVYLHTDIKHWVCIYLFC